MCLLVLLVAVQLSNVLVLRSLDIKYFSFVNVSIPASGVTHILNLPTVCVNDAKLQTNPPSILHFKIPNLPKIDVYNFRYEIGVEILMKLFFL